MARHNKLGGVSLVFCIAAFLLMPTGLAREIPYINLPSTRPAHGELSFPKFDSVLELNRMLFHGNVLKDAYVANWLVFFCASWLDECQHYAQNWALASADSQSRLNDQIFTSEVRFAIVDCATDKVLCNEQDVDAYPTVLHYRKGKRVSKWSGGRQNDATKLAKWLQKRLGSLAEEKAKEQQIAKNDSSKHRCDILCNWSESCGKAMQQIQQTFWSYVSSIRKAALS